MRDRKKKVLFLPRWYPDERDLQMGIFIQNHAKAVSPLVDVTVLAFFPQEDLEKQGTQIIETTENGFPEIRVYYPTQKTGGLRGIHNLFSYLRACRRGLKHLKKHHSPTDLVHVHVLTRPALIAYFLKLKYGIPFLLSEHWTGYSSGEYQKFSSLKRRLMHFLASRAEMIISVSKNLENSLKKEGFKNQFRIIRNVVKTPEPKGEFNSGEEKIKILNVSDLVDSNKNISGLLEVFTKISKQFPQAELHIIGGGKDEQMLHKKAEESGLLDKKIFLYGRKFNDFVFQKMQECKFYVCNSRIETFSVATAEALICGKPVLVTRCGGPEEFVKEEQGLVIEAGNKQELEEALKLMIKTHGEYNAKVIREYAQANFSAEKIGKELYGLYSEILNPLSIQQK